TQNVVTPGYECDDENVSPDSVAAAAAESKSHEFIAGTDPEKDSFIRNKLRRRLEEDETDYHRAPKKARTAK
uniref:Uncharacterized protein n=1 Tax=Panagrolaimus sp. ES5 TaxID=591445 RepID=A0AC34FU88_9BILA